MSAGVVVGLMSGTSLDGISAAVARFTDGSDGRIDVDLLAYLSHSYTPAQRSRLSAALGVGTPAEYCRLNFDLGEWLAVAAIQVMAEAGIARDDIAAIASHGQTIWHIVANRDPRPGSFQPNRLGRSDLCCDGRSTVRQSLPPYRLLRRCKTRAGQRRTEMDDSVL